MNQKKKFFVKEKSKAMGLKKGSYNLLSNIGLLKKLNKQSKKRKHSK